MSDRFNQRGEVIKEETLYSDGVVHDWANITDQDRDQAIALLCEKLGVEIYRTNATKRGYTEVQLRGKA